MSDLLPPLLLPLLAMLPAMVGIQINQAVSSAKRRYPVAAEGPRSASMRRLVKALKLHSLTTSVEIRLNGYDFPEMTVVRCLAKDEIDGIADWMAEERVDVYLLKPEAQR